MMWKIVGPPKASVIYMYIYIDYLRTRRTDEMKSGDIGGLLEYLQIMQSKDLNFSYAIQVDFDDLNTNIFLGR